MAAASGPDASSLPHKPGAGARPAVREIFPQSHQGGLRWRQQEGWGAPHGAEGDPELMAGGFIPLTATPAQNTRVGEAPGGFSLKFLLPCCGDPG